VRKELLPAQHAIWRAGFSLERALAISSQRKALEDAVILRARRAHESILGAIPHIERAVGLARPLVVASERRMDYARRQLDRAGGDLDEKALSKLPADKRWRITVAKGKLDRARDELGRRTRAVAGLETALESSRQAERLLRNQVRRGLGEASGLVSQAESGIAAAQTALSGNFLTPYKDQVFQISLVIGAMALGLGVFGLTSLHAKSIARKRPGWGNSLAFIISLLAMTLVGFTQKYVPEKTGIGTLTNDAYTILFNGALAALGATMFSLVAFYIVSAAYRAFRMKSAESAMMMTAAFLVMLSLVPVGVLLTAGLHGGWSALRLENIGDWILKFPNTAAQRGMAFGIGVGGLAMAIRIWFSLERGSYFDKQV